LALSREPLWVSSAFASATGLPEEPFDVPIDPLAVPPLVEEPTDPLDDAPPLDAPDDDAPLEALGELEVPAGEEHAAIT
jgi:hypothetical protein